MKTLFLVFLSLCLPFSVWSKSTDYDQFMKLSNQKKMEYVKVLQKAYGELEAKSLKKYPYNFKAQTQINKFKTLFDFFMSSAEADSINQSKMCLFGGWIGEYKTYNNSISCPLVDTKKRNGVEKECASTEIPCNPLLFGKTKLGKHFCVSNYVAGRGFQNASFTCGELARKESLIDPDFYKKIFELIKAEPQKFNELLAALKVMCLCEDESVKDNLYRKFIFESKDTKKQYDHGKTCYALINQLKNLGLQNPVDCNECVKIDEGAHPEISNVRDVFKNISDYNSFAEQRKLYCTPPQSVGTGSEPNSSDATVTPEVKLQWVHSNDMSAENAPKVTTDIISVSKDLTICKKDSKQESSNLEDCEFSFQLNDEAIKPYTDPVRIKHLAGKAQKLKLTVTLKSDKNVFDSYDAEIPALDESTGGVSPSALSLEIAISEYEAEKDFLFIKIQTIQCQGKTTISELPAACVLSVDLGEVQDAKEFYKVMKTDKEQTLTAKLVDQDSKEEISQSLTIPAKSSNSGNNDQSNGVVSITLSKSEQGDDVTVSTVATCLGESDLNKMDKCEIAFTGIEKATKSDEAPHVYKLKKTDTNVTVTATIKEKAKPDNSASSSITISKKIEVEEAIDESTSPSAINGRGFNLPPQTGPMPIFSSPPIILGPTY